MLTGKTSIVLATKNETKGLELCAEEGEGLYWYPGSGRPDGVLGYHKDEFAWSTVPRELSHSLANEHIEMDLRDAAKVLLIKSASVDFRGTYHVGVFYDSQAESIRIGPDIMRAFSRVRMGLDLDMYFDPQGDLDESAAPYRPTRFKSTLTLRSRDDIEEGPYEVSCLAQSVHLSVSRLMSLMRVSDPAAIVLAEHHHFTLRMESYYGWGRPPWIFSAASIKQLAALGTELHLVTYRHQDLPTE